MGKKHIHRAYIGKIEKSTEYKHTTLNCEAAKSDLISEDPLINIKNNKCNTIYFI